MAIFRPQEPTRDFTKSARSWVRLPKLDLKSKGLLAYIASHAPGYDLTVEQIVAENEDGPAAVRSGIAKLEKLGYLKRTRRRKEDGTLGGYDWHIIDFPDRVSAGGDQMPEIESGSEHGEPDVSAGSDQARKSQAGSDLGKRAGSAGEDQPRKPQAGSEQEQQGVSAGNDQSRKSSTKKTKEPREEDQREPNSLSARTSVTAAREDADDRERDELTSSEDQNPNPNTPTPLTAAHRMLAKRNIHGVEADQIISYIHLNVEHPIQGDGWWYRADGNGSLDDWITRWHESLTTTTSTDTEPAAPCPLHSRFPLYNCQVCWADWMGGDDPYTGRESERPSDWWQVYDRQKRSSKRGNALAENAQEWLTGDLTPSADLPVMHPHHPRRMINSHANQDRYDEKL